MTGDSIDGAFGSKPHNGQYGLQLMELRELMEHRGHEAYNIIVTKYGSVIEMCNKLFTSPNEGLYFWFTLNTSEGHLTPISLRIGSFSCHENQLIFVLKKC